MKSRTKYNSIHRLNNQTRIKLGHAHRSNIMGERFSWFTDGIEPFGEIECLTPTQFIGLIEE